ncbi:hypothetical protein ADUPG1_000246, partial [Aduncisulcus paluster]
KKKKGKRFASREVKPKKKRTPKTSDSSNSFLKREDMEERERVPLQDIEIDGGMGSPNDVLEVTPFDASPVTSSEQQHKETMGDLDLMDMQGIAEVGDDVVKSNIGHEEEEEEQSFSPPPPPPFPSSSLNKTISIDSSS